MLRAGIEIFEILLNALDELLEVVNNLICTVITIVTELVISEDDTLAIHNVLFSDLEVLLRLREDELLKHFLVVLIDHTIGEDTHVLVEPELQELDLGVDSLLMSTANTLEDLADITQVKGVMRLVGSGLELHLDTRVDNLGGLDHLVKLALDILIE